MKSVQQLDDTHLHLVPEIAADTKEWDAEITEQHPEERAAWQSTSGARNAGLSPFADSTTTTPGWQRRAPDRGMARQHRESFGTVIR